MRILPLRAAPPESAPKEEQAMHTLPDDGSQRSHSLCDPDLSLMEKHPGPTNSKRERMVPFRLVPGILTGGDMKGLGPAMSLMPATSRGVNARSRQSSWPLNPRRFETS